MKSLSQTFRSTHYKLAGSYEDLAGKNVVAVFKMSGPLTMTLIITTSLMLVTTDGGGVMRPNFVYGNDVLMKEIEKLTGVTKDQFLNGRKFEGCPHDPEQLAEYIRVDTLTEEYLTKHGYGYNPKDLPVWYVKEKAAEKAAADFLASK